MKKISIFALFLIFAACSESDGVLDYGIDGSISCKNSLDCPPSMYCDLSKNICASRQGSDGSDSGSMPDNENGNLPDGGDSSNKDGDDSGNKNPVTGKTVTCDCFGTNYSVTGTFASEEAWCKADADGDGIPNCIEVPLGVPVDSDENGIADYLEDDADGDGIPDSVECPSLPCRDTDGDRTPDYRDLDADGDAIPDQIECFEQPCVDADSDGIPDWLDLDSDGDGIPDLYEGTTDFDKDGVPNFLDLDSDGDGIPDSVECPSLPCRNSDGQGVSDFLEFDSDGDGLPDNQEIECPILGIHTSVSADSDGDGFSDLAEILMGSDPCDAAQGVKDVGVEFYFELPYQGEEKDDVLTFTPQILKADIFFNVDTTGSMREEANTLKSSLSGTIIPQVAAAVSDSAFGVSYFDDYPVSSYGFSNDKPFGLLQSPTTDTATAQEGVNKLPAHSGYDGPESGYPSLWHIATGNALLWKGGSVPEGPVGFRYGTIPIVIHVTDAASHDSNNTPYDPSYVFTNPSQEEVISAMNGIGAKVISVVSKGGDLEGAKNQLTTVSNLTGAVVPSCAQAGRTTLLYEIGADGAGLDNSVVSGIEALVKYAAFSVVVEPADDGDGSTIDTSCFLKKIEALEYVPVDDCAAQVVAQPAQFNGAGYNNGFTNFSTGTSRAGTPGNLLKFRVVAQNDVCVPSLQTAQMFKAFIKVIDNATGSTLDVQEVTIIVPGSSGGVEGA